MSICNTLNQGIGANYLIGPEGCGKDKEFNISVVITALNLLGIIATENNTSQSMFMPWRVREPKELDIISLILD